MEITAVQLKDYIAHTKRYNVEIYIQIIKYFIMVFLHIAFATVGQSRELQ